MKENGPPEVGLVNRREELQQVVMNLLHGRHTLLVGERGIGKSRLMSDAREILSGTRHSIELSPRVAGRRGRDLPARMSVGSRRLMVVYHVSPYGDCLKEFCEQLHAFSELLMDPSADPGQPWQTVRKRLTGLGNVKTQELIIRSLRSARKPFIVFLDSLDRITPTHQDFLEKLLATVAVCGAVTRPKESVHFKKIWGSFSKIELAPLSERDAMALTRLWMASGRVRSLDAEFHAHQILKAANGNPFRIRSMIWEGSREVCVTHQQIRGLAKEEEGGYFNMGPIYIFGASVFTLYKIFSLGLDNREAYIYFSALGFLVYLTFRIFRTFFLFRPQRGA